MARWLLYSGDAAGASACARELATREGRGPSERISTLLLALWAQKVATGALDPLTSAAVRAMVLDEQCWRPVALIPDDLRDEIFGETGHAWATVVPVLRTPVDLSERERALLVALDSPATLTEIARSMHLSVNTVKTHLRHLYRKLGVSSRSEAARELV